MPVLFDLSDRGKLRVAGADRVRYLNGQVTNDVRKANANLAMPACVLNAKGKLDAFVFIAAREGDFVLDADAQLRETLPHRLERYAIADEVSFEDVTDDFALFHVTAEVEPDLPNESPNEWNWRSSKRFGVSGWDLWLEAGTHDRALQLLAAREVRLGDDARETFRVEQGIPRWGRELTNEVIPPEANLENAAIDYAKGCYIGQEVISRMKMSGKTSRQLCGLVSLGGAPLAAGMKLMTADEGKEVGRLTSAAESARCGEIALGFVKRGFNSLGTQLRAGDPLSCASVRVVALPFAPRDAR